MDDGTEAVGFTACADTTRLYGFSEIVLFDRELTNYGGYYNTETSSFICPVDGIYIFTLAITVYIDTETHVIIMRNDVELTSTYSRTDEEPFNHGTNMVVTECLVGDVVWPQLDWVSGTGNIHAGPTKCYTTFSGVLIKTISI